MENQLRQDISRLLELTKDIREGIRYLQEHRNLFEGEPMLDFSEVCELLHQSERQVRRYREQGRLVGFNIGRRRMYLHSEVKEFIRRMRCQGKLEDTTDTLE